MTVLEAIESAKIKHIDKVRSGEIPNMNLPWFESPFFSQMLDATDLDPSVTNLVTEYAENGYLIIDLNVGKLPEQITKSLAEKHKKEGHPGHRWRLQDQWISNEYVKMLACRPEVLKLLRVLYRREPIPFQTLNFCEIKIILIYQFIIFE